MTRGAFIVIEGIDGCGSTTQVRQLAERLRTAGHDVVGTCEPTRGPMGSLIRQALRHELLHLDGTPRAFDWASMALLFAADRVDHNATVIEPALARGQIVVSDRYDLSSLAYQSLTAPEGADSLSWIRELNRRARRPDLTVVVDVRAEVAAERRGRRGGDAELFEVDELQRRLAAVYARAEALVPRDRLIHVSGEGTQGEVEARIVRVVEPLLVERNIG